jgi:phage anti-repressor protein
MTNLIPFSKDLAQSLTDSRNQYPVDFDEAWQWIQYTRKDSAKKKLIRNFELNIDYVIRQMAESAPSGGCTHYEQIKLTVDCFKQLAMMAGTSQGREIRKYFLECERTVKEVVPAQNTRLRELELANENMKLQIEYVSKQDNRIALHGLPVALLLEGKAHTVVEVEKPTIEIIDERHNVSFKGQTLKQLAEYLSKISGIRFKTGADLKRALEKLGRGDLIAQTLRSVPSDYIPEEFVLDAIQALTNGDRQQLIGE